MTLRKICDVKNNEVTIHLPDTFKNNKKVLVIVDDIIDTRASKLELLQQASSDSLFIADVKEINRDFSAIDHESI